MSPADTRRPHPVIIVSLRSNTANAVTLGCVLGRAELRDDECVASFEEKVGLELQLGLSGRLTACVPNCPGQAVRL